MSEEYEKAQIEEMAAHADLMRAQADHTRAQAEYLRKQIPRIELPLQEDEK